jgi:starch synthase (maltosyl-transferring)
MRALAKLGFSQSYTYFTWRNHKQELIEYFQELRRPEWADAMRPNLWPNTPDILPEFLQRGGHRPSGSVSRWPQPRGLVRHLLGLRVLRAPRCCRRGVPRQREVPAGGLAHRGARATSAWIRPLNEIRHAEAALQRDDVLEFFECDDPQVIFYGKRPRTVQPGAGGSEPRSLPSLTTATAAAAAAALRARRAEVVEVEERLAASVSSGAASGHRDHSPREAGRGVDGARSARTEQAFDYFY